MPIAFRSAAPVASADAVDRVTVDRPAGVVDGDVLVFEVTCRADRTFSSEPAGLTLVGGEQVTSGGSAGSNARGRTYTRVASAEPTSYTFVFSGATFANASCGAYSGVDSTTPRTWLLPRR